MCPIVVAFIAGNLYCHNQLQSISLTREQSISCQLSISNQYLAVFHVIKMVQFSVKYHNISIYISSFFLLHNQLIIIHKLMIYQDKIILYNKRCTYHIYMVYQTLYFNKKSILFIIIFNFQILNILMEAGLP